GGPLAAEGAAVTGIDPSEKSLAEARTHAKRSGLAIDYRLATAEDLASGSFAEPFDLVFAVDVLEHVDDLDGTIAGIARVLAPGGGSGSPTHRRRIAGLRPFSGEEADVQPPVP